MNRERTLRLPGTDKLWAASRKGTIVTIRSGATGKERTSKKPYPDAATAEAALRKEEGSRLKKGYVWAGSPVEPGAPAMHRFLGGGYTGALVAADVGGRLLCNRPGGPEELMFVGADAEVTAGFSLPPETIAWRAIDAPALGRVLVLADHGVLAWSPADGTVLTVAKGNRSPASFLSVAGSCVALYEEPFVVPQEIAAGRDLLRHEVRPELYGGHSLQMEGALSPDGGTLAMCAAAGELRLLDVASGEARTVPGGFEMVARFAFTPDGRVLLASEQYGRWALLAFDAETGARLPGWPELRDLPGASFALDPSGRRLALTRRNRIEIYDFPAREPRLQFEIEHAVKRSAIAWIGPHKLGVRTDSGLASLYFVGDEK